MGQGPCAAERDGVIVDAAAAVDRAPGLCATVTMPAVSDTRASSVEVAADFGRRVGLGWSQGYLGSGNFMAPRASIEDSGVGVGGVWHTWEGTGCTATDQL